MVTGAFFFILKHQYEGLSENPKIVSDAYQEILSTGGYRKIHMDILAENLAEVQRLDNDGILR